jgi:hypothetical protein
MERVDTRKKEMVQSELPDGIFISGRYPHGHREGFRREGFSFLNEQYNSYDILRKKTSEL